MRKKRERMMMKMWQNIFQMLNLVIGNKRFFLYYPCSVFEFKINSKLKVKNQILKNKCDKRSLTKECQMLRENKENLNK